MERERYEYNREKVIRCLIRSFDFQIRSIITWAGFFYTSLILLNLLCVIVLCVVAMVRGCYSYRYIPFTSICVCNMPIQVLYLFC